MSLWYVTYRVYHPSLCPAYSTSCVSFLYTQNLLMGQLGNLKKLNLGLHSWTFHDTQLAFAASLRLSQWHMVISFFSELHYQHESSGKCSFHPSIIKLASDLQHHLVWLCCYHILIVTKFWRGENREKTAISTVPRVMNLCINLSINH